jgi:hypothetical protein
MNSLLGGWDNFYVIIGSSAAALTGLQFVVVALSAEVRTATSTQALSAFGTPTIVHFCCVLLIAAVITTPGHTTITLTGSLVAIGTAGVIYAMYVFFTARRQRGYKPVFEDWLWHAMLPLVAYAWLFVAGAYVPRAPEESLYCVAGCALMLLFIGIHNAWDAAVWMTTSRPKHRSRL